MKKLIIAAIIFCAGCGGEETEELCVLLPGEYHITSMITATDCPETFGKTSTEMKDNETVWTISEKTLTEREMKCGETHTDQWQQHIITGPCECFVSYNDVYYITSDSSFKMNRRVDLVCLPYLDPNDTGCNKECYAEGKVEGVKQ